MSQLTFEEPETDFAQQVVDLPVAEEMSESFLAYSLSVITSRAIPDVRDGLKPVQRRILWSMLQMGIRPDTAFRKSARIVGDTMGRYHPHGDAAIYDTLTRMGQDFSRMVPFIDPQGNFGSLDDPPAAARYTECRLSEAAMTMVSELDEDTVDFRPTYDGESEEPTVLPGLLPNLLVNGASGIAVGMATNMAPHNLTEVYDAIELVMTRRRPRPTTEELMAVLPGPDFPSGGIVVDDGLADACETGRGSIRVRARVHVEQVTRARQAIIVTELPYLIGSERVLARVQELVASGRLAGVAGIADLSDIGGLRIQIDVKPAANTQAVLAELYRLTPLEETFGINNVALVDGVPTTLGVYDLCRHYVDHRLEVVQRRTRHRLGRAEARLHIVEGLLLALDSIDEVVALIRGSETPAEARAGLIEHFGLTEAQANQILDMQLRRLTALARIELETEADGLRSDIAEYQRLLGSEQRRRTLVMRELSELAEAHGGPRRSEIVAADQAVIAIPEDSRAVDGASEAGPAQPCVVALSTSGSLGRAPTDAGERGKRGRHDLLAGRLRTSTDSHVAAITSQGRALVLACSEIPEDKGRIRGAAAARMLGLPRDEPVLGVVAVGGASEGFDGETAGGASGERIVVVSANGVARQVRPATLAPGRSPGPLIELAPLDSVAAAFAMADDDHAALSVLGDAGAGAVTDAAGSSASGGDSDGSDSAGSSIVVVADDGQVTRFASDDVSARRKGALGMKLREGARVVAAAPASDESMIVVFTSASRLQAVPVGEFDMKRSGGVGTRIARLASGERVLGAWIGPPDVELFALMAADDDPRKIDPNPVLLALEPVRRDLVPKRTERQIKALGPARW